MDRIKYLIRKWCLRVPLLISKNKKISIKDYNKISNLPNYKKTPFIFFLENHIDIFIEKTIAKIDSFKVKPKIGIELEFYILDEIEKQVENNTFFNNLKKFIAKNNIDIGCIEKERGFNQFEIKFSPYLDMFKLINDFLLLKNYMEKFDFISFKAINKFCDASSSLQVNISILDENGINLFKREKNNNNELEESNILQRLVSSLIETTNIYLSLYTKNENCLQRYNENINIEIFKLGKVPAPTYNSWGINNRSASIRIPTPTNFKDIKTYEEEDGKNRRIEFRVPSSDADIKKVMFGILNNIAFILENEPFYYINKSNFNILKNHENCSKIEMEDFSFLDERATKYLKYLFL